MNASKGLLAAMESVKNTKRSPRKKQRNGTNGTKRKSGQRSSENYELRATCAPSGIRGSSVSGKKRRSEYSPSILQDEECCWLCGRRDRKLDRHEAFFGPFRQKSKQDGLWVLLCHYPCHEGPHGAQYDPEIRRYLSAYAQGKAMEVYGWDTAEWIRRYGKNWR